MDEQVITYYTSIGIKFSCLSELTSYHNRGGIQFLYLVIEPFHCTTSPANVIPFIEKHFVIRIENPVVLVALHIRSGQLHEAVVQREVVANRVAPALILPIAVVRKVLGYVVVYLPQRESLVRRLLHRHRDQRKVGIRRFHALHLLVPVVRINLVGLDRARGHDRDRLGRGCGLCALAHGERLLQRQSNLPLAAVVGVRRASCKAGRLRSVG